MPDPHQDRSIVAAIAWLRKLPELKGLELKAALSVGPYHVRRLLQNMRDLRGELGRLWGIIDRDKDRAAEADAFEDTVAEGADTDDLMEALWSQFEAEEDQ